MGERYDETSYLTRYIVCSRLNVLYTLLALFGRSILFSDFKVNSDDRSPGWEYGLYRARLGASKGLYDVHTVYGVHSSRPLCNERHTSEKHSNVSSNKVVTDTRPGEDFQ